MIEALDRVIQILDLFSSDRPEWTVSEVSRELDIPKTTVWEYMRDLANAGLLRRPGKTHYRLGWRAYQLGVRARSTSEISQPARTVMLDLVEKFGQTVQLATRYGQEVAYLEKFTPQVGIRVSVNSVGERLPAHCTAVGKVLLAHLSSSELRSLYVNKKLIQMTNRSIGTFEELEQELAQIHDHGYAYEIDEAIEGMACVAAPVTNEYGNVAWALSMSFLEYRFKTHSTTYKEAVVAAAERLSHIATT